jgi:hypothetical protein
MPDTEARRVSVDDAAPPGRRADLPRHRRILAARGAAAGPVPGSVDRSRSRIRRGTAALPERELPRRRDALLVRHEGTVHRSGAAVPGAMKSMSPWPSRLSAPLLVEDGARIHLGRDLESDAAGNVGLDEAGDDIHRRPLRGDDHVDAGRTRLLCEAGDQFLDLLADHHHHVGELVDDDDDVRHGLRELGAGRPSAVNTRERVRDGRRPSPARCDPAVVAADVAHAERRHQLVATLHFRHAPAQGVGGFLHVRDDRRRAVPECPRRPTTRASSGRS